MHHDWTHEVFPEELREIYDPEEVTINRYESIDDLVDRFVNPKRISDLSFNNSRSFTGFVNFLDLAHKYFVSQLKEVKRTPQAILPKSLTVKSLNLHDFSSVPTYWVSSNRMKQIY